MFNAIKKFGIMGTQPREGLCIGDSVLSLERNRRMTLGYGSGSNDFYIWRKRKGKLLIDPKTESTPHMIIVGMSGFGKSTLLKSIIGQVRSSGRPVLIFDAHNEHEDMVRSCGGAVYDASSCNINILALDGATVGERILTVTRLLSSVYGLGQIQSTKLSTCLWYVYRMAGAVGRKDTILLREPTIKDLIFELLVFIKNSRTSSETNTLRNMRSKLSTLDVKSSSSAPNLDSLLNGMSSFSLSNISSPEMRSDIHQRAA